MGRSQMGSQRLAAEVSAQDLGPVSRPNGGLALLSLARSGVDHILARLHEAIST